MDRGPQEGNLSEMTRLEAEVLFISSGMSHICNCWDLFVEFFNEILQQEQNILIPMKHDQLFYDDAVFSRSRRYFWAIDTLTQIDSLITDNIYKWTFYKKNWIESTAKVSKNMPEIGWLWLAELNHSSLLRQRELFRSHLASFQLLRDGVR